MLKEVVSKYFANPSTTLNEGNGRHKCCEKNVEISLLQAFALNKQELRLCHEGQTKHYDLKRLTKLCLLDRWPTSTTVIELVPFH